MREAARTPERAHDPASPSPRLFRKNISVTMLTFLTGGLAGFAVQTVLAREHGPRAYGTYIAAFSLVTLVAAIDELGGARYLVRESVRDPGRLGSLIDDVVIAKTVLAAIAIAVTTTLGAILGFHGDALLLVALLAVMSGANAIVRGLRAGLAAIERLEVSTAVSVTNNLATAVGMIWILAAGGSILAAITYSAAVSITLIPLTWLALRRWVTPGAPRSIRRSARTARMGLPFATVGALSFASPLAATLVIRGLLGSTAAGLFGAPARLIEVLAFAPAIAVEALYRSLSYLATHARDAFARTMERAVAAMFLLGLGIAAGGALVGDRVLGLVFGPDFAAASGVFAILLWSLPLAFPAWLLVAGVVIAARPQAAAKILGASFAWTLGADLLVVPHAGAEGAALVAVSAECFIAAACTRALAHSGIRLRWGRVAWIGAIAAIALGAVVQLTRGFPLLVPISLGAATYGAVLLALGAHTQLGIRLPWGRADEPAIERADDGDDGPLISIVMPMHNAASTVAEAIDGMLRQTIEDIEIIVLDDGSTDGSAEIVAAIDDPRVRLVHRLHRGLVATANDGFRLARGRFIARADADDLFDPTILERELAVLTEHPGTVAAGVWIRKFGACRSAHRYPTKPGSIRRALRHGNPLSQPALMRADALRASGGLRDVRWEDWDLWVRLARDHDLRNVPETLLHLRARPTSLFHGVGRVDGRRAKLGCMLLAARILGPSPRSIAAIAKTVVALLVYRVLDRGSEPTLGSSPILAEPVAPTMSVIVPTYGRPPLLARCLTAIAAQDPPAMETIVVVRSDDAATLASLEAWIDEDPTARTVVNVERPGLVHALIAGTATARGDVVAYLDDDAFPRPGWLAELGRMFLDPSVGAAGGALVDRVDGRVVEGTVRVPGRITWYGRIIGRHHHTSTHYGDTDWMTGSNMAFRRELARHDARLMHSANGLALANDTDVCLSVRAAGHRVAYTPFAVVEHDATSYRDPALGSRVRGDDVVCASANRTYTLLKFLPPHRRIAFRLYGALVGASTVPGPLRVIAEISHPARALEMARRMTAARRGRIAGVAMWRAWQRDQRASTPGGVERVDAACPQRIAILSPHLDDAALSLGARVFDVAGSGTQVDVITVFAGDPTSTTPAGPWDARAGFRTAGEAARARRAEDARAWAKLGATSHWLDFEDDQYGCTADDARIWEEIAPLIAEAVTVYVPGHPLHHADHRRLHDLVRARAAGKPNLVLYAEQPYVLRSGAPATDGAWTAAPTSRAARRAKRGAIAAYRSQWPLMGGRFLPLRLRRTERVHGGEMVAPLHAARQGVRPARLAQARVIVNVDR